MLGALLSKYSFERICGKNRSFDISIINVDEENTFNQLFDQKILMNGRLVSYARDDLQSFTLSRFMPPELMGYKGTSYVIDPDIFCLSEDFTDIFDMKIEKPVGATLQNGKFLSSSMLLKNQYLKHWKVIDIIESLKAHKYDYRYFMSLDFENQSVSEIPTSFNHLDRLDEETILLHNTNRLTQPWKTGLKVDFRQTKMKPFLGVIPREIIHFVLGRRKSKYQQHSDPNQIRFFLDLTQSAIDDGAITKDFIDKQIDAKFVRADLLQLLRK